MSEGYHVGVGLLGMETVGGAAEASCCFLTVEVPSPVLQPALFAFREQGSPDLTPESVF